MSKSAAVATDARTGALHRELGSVPRRPHLFNGRLLTAEVLRDERSAVLDDLAKLGKAVGPGVVHGLRVRKESRSRRLVVTPGFGLNGAGDPLCLTGEVSFPVSIPRGEDEEGADFAPCARDDEERRPVDAGCYLLVVAPTSEYDGRVPRVAVHGSTAGPGAGGCGAAWRVEGLDFRLVALPEDAPCDDEGLRRNRLANWCLTRIPGLLPGLDPVPGMDDGDLPLCALYWDGSAVRHVDEWAARRSPVAVPEAGLLSFFLPATRTQVGRARLLSFQDHLMRLLEEPSGGAVVLRDHMRWLPPAAVVVSSSSRRRSHFVDSLSAFAGIEVGDRGQATSDEMILALERSFHLSAVDLEDDPHLDLYEIRGTHSRTTGVLYVRRLRDLLTVSVPPPAEGER